MKCRLIRLHEFNAYTNMALDEAIIEAVRKKESLPTIRFYTWKPHAISIGYFQGLHNEINLELAKKEGFDIVRRITGGGAVVHDKEITYSIIAPEEYFPKDVIKSYSEICGYIVDALRSLGIPAEFKPINDVLVDGKKISGSAQTRREGILLQHGTVLFDVDAELIMSLLKGKEEKNSLTKSSKKSITSITGQKNISQEQALAALEKSFCNGKEITVGNYSEKELSHASELAKEKYSTKEWNAMR